MAGIFISYRREDSKWTAGRIFDWLRSEIDPSKLFMDVDGIPAGVDFVEELGRRVGDCDALIAVVGKSWVDARDKNGRRRLDDPKDLVRIEIEAALEREVRVIPVLVDETEMPRIDELPFSLKSFSRRNAMRVSHPTFGSDMDRLTKTLLNVLAPEAIRRKVGPLASRNGQASEDLGAYSRESVAPMEGRYLTIRPTFSPPGSIYAYCTEIRWDAGLCRLGFYDLERPDKAFSHSGYISAPHQSDAIYLVTNVKGKLRLTMLGRPTIDGEMFGLMTTLKPERSSRYTPAACPVAFVPETKVPSAVAMSYGRLDRETPAYVYASAILDRIVEEGYAAFFASPGLAIAPPVAKPQSVAARRRQAETERRMPN